MCLFHAAGTPLSEIQEFRTIRRAFPRTKQTLYPAERPDAVPGQHLHFTQVPMYEKISQDTGLTEGFHVTIRFDGEYKKLSRQEVKNACLERLRRMNIPLGSTYSNPIDIGINTGHPSKISDSNAEHFLSDLLTHSWFHSMLCALPGYQFPYTVMNRCFYLIALDCPRGTSAHLKETRI